jgi:hypothetical protein
MINLDEKNNVCLDVKLRNKGDIFKKHIEKKLLE